VLKRLAHACRACHEHARARGLLAQKAVAKAALREALARKDEILSLSADGFATARRDGGLIFTSPRLGELVHRLPSTGVPTTLAEVDATLHEAGAPGARLHEQAQTLRHCAATNTLVVAKQARRLCPKMEKRAEVCGASTETSSYGWEKRAEVCRASTETSSYGCLPTQQPSSRPSSSTVSSICLD
jgi:hypothetical protein